MTLKPAEFHPRPKIDSVVVRIEFSHAPFRSADGTPYSYALFQRIVRTSFNQRRKTILNTLSGAALFSENHPIEKIDVEKVAVDKSVRKILTEEAISDAGLSPSLRPEVLSLENFISLTIAFEKIVARQGVVS